MSHEVFALEGRGRCPQRAARRTTIVRPAISWSVSRSKISTQLSRNQREDVITSQPYTFRTRFSQSTFSLQPSSAQALAPKNTQNQKLASVHVSESVRSHPQLSSPKPKRVIFTHLKAADLALQSIMYRLRKPYCTAVFCSVPRNQIFSRSLHLRQLVSPQSVRIYPHWPPFHRPKPNLGIAIVTSPNSGYSTLSTQRLAPFSGIAPNANCHTACLLI